LKILITGGAGYIGSHTLIVFDNLSNSSKESIKRVEKIINKSISFEEGDVRDKKTIEDMCADSWVWQSRNLDINNRGN
jgi:UDP-glucose 4-epimerase